MSGHIDPRRALWAFAFAATLVASACGGRAEPTAPTTAPVTQPKVDFQPKVEAPAKAEPQAKAEAPAKPAIQPRVNRLVMGIVPPATEGNAIRDLNVTTGWQLRPMYEYLLMIDASTGKPIPGRANEWILEPDGRSYRMKLRQGIQFHGGWGEFTAKDVVFTWQDVTHPEAQYGDAQVFRDMVKQIDVVNDYEVVFRLGDNAPFFLYWISQGQGGFEIRSQRHAEAIGNPTMQTAPLAGTGTYQFKERAQGQFIRYERVPFQHWRAMPDFPEFEFRFQRE